MADAELSRPRRAVLLVPLAPHYPIDAFVEFIGQQGEHFYRRGLSSFNLRQLSVLHSNIGGQLRVHLERTRLRTASRGSAMAGSLAPRQKNSEGQKHNPPLACFAPVRLEAQ